MKRWQCLRFLLSACLIALAEPGFAQALDDMLNAVKSNDMATVERLIQRGIDVNSTDSRGETLLMLASREGHEGLVSRLISSRARVNARNGAGETALMLASIKGHLGIVSRLQAAGAEVNHSGWSPLLYAAFEGKTEVCRFLLKQGALIDARAPNGATALMIAARGGHLETVRLLLWEDADPGIKTDTGATALQWALKAGNTAVADLLKQADVKE